MDLEIEPSDNGTIALQLRAVLSGYRGRLYQERQLSVVRMIEAYWGQNANGSRSAVTNWDYTEKFEAVWEEMCRTAISGCIVNTSAWPSGRYVATNGQDLGTGLRLIPDFVRRVHGGVMVFDAKFYTTDALPDSYSVLKQLAYGLFPSREWHESGTPPERIIHVFLFPKLGNPGGETAKLRGRHVVAPVGRCASMRSPIYLVDLDYQALANAYLTNRQVDVETLASLCTVKPPKDVSSEG